MLITKKKKNPVNNRYKDEAHFFANGSWSRVGGLTFFICVNIHTSYYFFPDIKVNMTEQSRQARAVSRTSFKGHFAEGFLIHLSALCSFSGLSEHATIKKTRQQYSRSNNQM